MSQDFTISGQDREILRSLAERVRTHAESDVINERRQSWTAINKLQPIRPMVYIEYSGVQQQIPELQIKECTGGLAQAIENNLRGQLYAVEVLKDDTALEPNFPCGWHIHQSNYGVEVTHHTGDPGNEDGMGSFNWTPPIADLEKDFHLLKPRSFSVDRQASLDSRTAIENTFGDILPTRMRGNPWWTLGMTITAIDLIGLENLMVYMYDEPEALHSLMKFLMDDHMALLDFMEKENLLCINNENDYIGSGSWGYSDELGHPTPKTISCKDLWCLSESQETVGVGPDQFEEFVFNYQLPIIERFGLSYYGCCEPLHGRWHVIKKASNLRKVSVSPWCDLKFMAEELGSNYVFCRKPNPALISTSNMDEQAIRDDLKLTLSLCKEHNTPLEFIMKDVHTVNHQPERLSRWVEIAREEIDNICS